MKRPDEIIKKIDETTEQSMYVEITDNEAYTLLEYIKYLEGILTDIHYKMRNDGDGNVSLDSRGTLLWKVCTARDLTRDLTDALQPPTD